MWYQQQPLVVDSTVLYSARAPIVLRVRNGAAGRVGRCCMRTTAARGKARRNCTYLNHVPELRNACVRAECRDPMHTIILTNRSIEQHARTFGRIKPNQS